MDNVIISTCFILHNICENKAEASIHSSEEVAGLVATAVQMYRQAVVSETVTYINTAHSWHLIQIIVIADSIRQHCYTKYSEFFFLVFELMFSLRICCGFC